TITIHRLQRAGSISFSSAGKAAFRHTISKVSCPRFSSSSVGAVAPGRRIDYYDLDRAGGAAVAGRIPRDGGQGVAPIFGRGGVPGERVGGRGVFCTERSPIQLELDANDAHVVRGVG